MLKWQSGSVPAKSQRIRDGLWLQWIKEECFQVMETFCMTVWLWWCLHCHKSLSEFLFCTPKCGEFILYKYSSIQLTKKKKLSCQGQHPKAHYMAISWPRGMKNVSLWATTWCCRAHSWWRCQVQWCYGWFLGSKTIYLSPTTATDTLLESKNTRKDTEHLKHHITE